MGTYYWLANHTEKVYIDFNGAKLRDQENDFDRALLQRFLHMFCVHNAPSIQFVGDDTGGWDNCKDYQEITCDVMYDLFEDGFVPNRWQITFIYDKFQKANRLKELAEWMKKWDDKEKKQNARG